MGTDWQPFRLKPGFAGKLCAVICNFWEIGDALTLLPSKRKTCQKISKNRTDFVFTKSVTNVPLMT